MLQLDSFIAGLSLNLIHNPRLHKIFIHHENIVVDIYW
jgi:hypothetical protein